METEMDSGCRMVDCMVCFTPNCDILRRARERRYSFEHPAPGADEMADREELARDWAEQTWSVGESGWIKLGRGRMHRVEEISLLKQEVEALAAERDRWRRYVAHIRERLAAAQVKAKEWHHHAYCWDRRITAELLDGAQEIARLRNLAVQTEGEIARLKHDRDSWKGAARCLRAAWVKQEDAVKDETAILRQQLHHADGDIIDLTSDNDDVRQQRDRWREATRRLKHIFGVFWHRWWETGRAVEMERDSLRQQLDESERQLTLWIEADNANREQLAAAKDHVRMVAESWRQLKTVHAEKPENHAVPLALLLAHVGMLAGDSDTDAYLFLAALNRTMLDRARCADVRQLLAEAKAELRQWRGCPSCMEDHPEGTMCPPHETQVTGQAWRQRQTRQWAERARIAEQELASANAARERAEAKAGVLRAEMEKIAASTAGDDEPGDRSPRRAGWECVQVARTALASDAGEKAAAVLAAATAHAHWLWSYHGRHYEGGMPDERRLVAAVDAREKGEAECG